MAEPESQVSVVRRMYDRRAPVYEDSWHPAFAQYVVDFANLQPGEHVLDLACGTGLVTFAAAAKVGSTGSVIAIDVSDGMLGQAKTRLDREKSNYSNIQFFNHDIADLDSLDAVQEGSFDAITCASALVLLREPVKAMAMWFKYLKPGGRLVTDATHPRNLIVGIAFEKVYARLGLAPPQYRLWMKSEDSFREALQAAGFDRWNIEIIFKEQAGYRERHYTINDAEQNFNGMIETEVNKILRDHNVVDEARKLFREEWAALADENGKILEVDGVYVAIARKQSTESFPSPSASLISGSCACGTISWTSDRHPTDSSFCYCITCRKISGGPFLAFMDFPISSITFTPPLSSPAVTKLQASPHAERTFCATCGSTLTMLYKADLDTIAIAIGSMDEEKSLPDFLKEVRNKHIYVRSKPAWYEIPEDGLPRQETMKSADWLLSDN